MAWTLTGDVAEYLTAAGGFLRARAAENTVQLAATETIRPPDRPQTTTLIDVADRRHAPRSPSGTLSDGPPERR